MFATIYTSDHSSAAAPTPGRHTTGPSANGRGPSLLSDNFSFGRRRRLIHNKLDKQNGWKIAAAAAARSEMEKMAL